MTLYSVKSQSLLSDNQREQKLKVKACGPRTVLSASWNVHVLAGRLLLVEMVSFFGPGCFLAAKQGGASYERDQNCQRNGG